MCKSDNVVATSIHFTAQLALQPCVVEKAEAKPAAPAAAAAASAAPVKADAPAKANAPAETNTIDTKTDQLIRALTFEDEVGDPMKAIMTTPNTNPY